MKKVGIDARLLGQTGVGVYIRNLLLHLSSIVPKDWKLYIYARSQDERVLVKYLTRTDNCEIRTTDAPWHSLREQTSFYNQLMRDNLDLMHFTYYSYPVLYKRPFISTVHDLTPLTFKTGRASTKNAFLYQAKHLALRFVLSSQIKNARAIITPSKSVKRDILKTFGSKYEDKIHPIYEGVDEELLKTKESVDLAKKLPKDFFLYVGNFYPHKNVEALIEAFAKVKEDAHLVLAGPDDYFAQKIVQSIKRMNQEDRITLLHSPTEEDKVFLYKHARALVHPSLAEGFGLTLLEAAHFNCPIIASDISVFQEIFGGFYTPFNPKDVVDIARALREFLNKKPSTNYSKLLEKYTFEKMTEATLDLYRVSLGQ